MKARRPASCRDHYEARYLADKAERAATRRKLDRARARRIAPSSHAEATGTEPS